MGIFCIIFRVFWSFFGLHATFLLSSSSPGQLIPSFSAEALSYIAENETDHLALLEFKTHITNDPLGVLSSWNSSTHFCKWLGVKCGRWHRRVSMLDLGSSKLAGSISPHIGNLSFLRILDVSDNSLSQQIPPALGHLSRLKYLYLNNNSFSGEIPSNISFCSKLVEFDAGWNSLVRKIPVEFGTLSKLELFFVNANNLIGSIPITFGNLSSLQRFSISQNYIGGMIPDALGQLANLTHIRLGDNILSGTIPPSFFNLSSIRVLDMSLNQLEGTLPSNLGITLPNLQVLFLSYNKFDGSIPPTISNGTNLQVLGIGRNKLTGSVPNLGKLSRLSTLTLIFNQLGSGRANDLNFLQSLLNATKMEILALDHNNFGGIFPKHIENFTGLRVLALNRNRISGNIPNGIVNLVNLEKMDLWDNQMSGGIPSEIGHLQELRLLWLQGNKFSGNIPSFFSNLTNLNSLHLGNNNLRGSIPPSLGLCKNLLELDLSRNDLIGTIPPALVSLPSLAISLDLSDNHLSGSLPSEVEILKSLGTLNLSYNMLSGEIPSSLGSCVSLERLFLQGNFLKGSFPSSLSYLRGIRILDLSSNNLSGAIPQFLQTLQLQYLNLSFNDFEGQVPMNGVFMNTSSVSVMGNKRLCGDVPKLQLPSCNLNKSEKRRLTLKLKIVVSVVLGILGVTILLSSLYFCCISKRSTKEPHLKNFETCPLRVSYQSLVRATDGFSIANLIGNGSFGSVYKGAIDESGTIVAIKVLNLSHYEASKSFAAECKALRNIRHRNLVKILTACSSIDYQGMDFKALVYEFMVNGSLEEWLYPTPITDGGYNITPRSSLTLLQRLNIAVDVASALAYLHSDCQPPIVHCDLKPSNILLDEEMMAHVGDFGIARILSEATVNLSNNQSSSIGVKGTIGYTAPEYGMGSEVSAYGDVYSYGVLLLEMFSGKRPTDDMFKDSLNLHSFAKAALPMSVVEISDPMLLQEVEGETNNNILRNHKIHQCLISIFTIGVACSLENPAERMSMSHVASQLNSIRKKLIETGRRRREWQRNDA